jgi:putative oxidoreductase
VLAGRDDERAQVAGCPPDLSDPQRSPIARPLPAPVVPSFSTGAARRLAAMSAQITALSPSIGLLVLRVGVGLYMLIHGWGKVGMLFGGEAEKFGDPIGLGATFSLFLATCAEFGCSILVILGIATRFAAIPLAFTMAVAAFVVHAGDPWTMSAQGASKEPALLFFFPFVALFFLGGGRFALDAWFWQWLEARRAAKKK